MRRDEDAFYSVIQSYITSYVETRTPPLYINIPDVAGMNPIYTYDYDIHLSTLREVEQEIIVYDLDGYTNIAVFDLR